MFVRQLYFNKKKEGSLLALFESPVFDVHLIMIHLNRHDKPHLIEYLMNKLFREYGNDIKILDYYLP